MAGALVNSYDREPYKAAVRAFLDRGLTARRNTLAGSPLLSHQAQGPCAGGGNVSVKRGTVILFIRLIIGAVAAGQRGYFSPSNLGTTGRGWR